jgi:hypothetical protein
VKLSYSQYSTFAKCSRFWHNQYVEKLSAKESGASLFFGSAVDTSITALLNKDPNWRQKFTDRWKTAFYNNKAIDIFDNELVVFANSDFDGDILKPEDQVLMLDWAKQLDLAGMGTTGTQIFKEVQKVKKNPYKATTEAHKTFFRRCSWLSLQRKGELLIEAFFTQFYPKITKVISTQDHLTIKDPVSGDSIVGVLDMIVELQGYDKPVILDLKTAGQPYDTETLDISDQLTLYAAMAGDKYNTDQVGYVVLCKAIPKDIVAHCSKCNNVKSSQHRTCDAGIQATAHTKEVRCGGEWIESKIPRPEVQFMVQSKSKQEQELLLQDFSSVAVMCKNGLVFRNTNCCNQWFGGVCPYKNYCWKGDSTGLVKK